MTIDRICTFGFQVIDVCGIIGISEVEFFYFSVNKTFKKIKNHSKLPKLVSQSLFSNSNKIRIIFWFFTEIISKTEQN